MVALHICTQCNMCMYFPQLFATFPLWSGKYLNVNRWSCTDVPRYPINRSSLPAYYHNAAPDSSVAQSSLGFIPNFYTGSLNRLFRCFAFELIGFAMDLVFQRQITCVANPLLVTRSDIEVMTAAEVWCSLVDASIHICSYYFPFDHVHCGHQLSPTYLIL
jgi:hypothetical protein